MKKRSTSSSNSFYSKSAKTSSVSSRMKTLSRNAQSAYKAEHKTPTVRSWVFFIFRKIYFIYIKIGLLSLKYILFIVFVNFVAALLLNIGNTDLYNVISMKYDVPLTKIYPELRENEINQLLLETWAPNKLQYEPFLQFSESPKQGKYVNVSLNGYRYSTNQSGWPPNKTHLNIFLFGGSTTFGYGVPDDQTIASFLQENLRKVYPNLNISIYNFGRGYYFSTQERILFQQLLQDAYVPNIALFIDGINDFYYTQNEPAFTSKFDDFFKEKHLQPRTFLDNQIRKSPLYELFTTVLGNLFSSKGKITEKMDNYNNHILIERLVNRYLSNKNFIEEAAYQYGVKPVFIFQPVPTYKNKSMYYFQKGGFGNLNYVKFAYQYMLDQKISNSLGTNFYWLVDIQENLTEVLYVDKYHYSQFFSKKIAQEISNRLIEHNVITE